MLPPKPTEAAAAEGSGGGHPHNAHHHNGSDVSTKSMTTRNSVADFDWMSLSNGTGPGGVGSNDDHYATLTAAAAEWVPHEIESDDEGAREEEPEEQQQAALGGDSARRGSIAAAAPIAIAARPVGSGGTTTLTAAALLATTQSQPLPSSKSSPLPAVDQLLARLGSITSDTAADEADYLRAAGIVTRTRQNRRATGDTAAAPAAASRRAAAPGLSAERSALSGSALLAPERSGLSRSTSMGSSGSKCTPR